LSLVLNAEIQRPTKPRNSGVAKKVEHWISMSEWIQYNKRAPGALCKVEVKVEDGMLCSGRGRTSAGLGRLKVLLRIGTLISESFTFYGKIFILFGDLSKALTFFSRRNERVKARRGGWEVACGHSPRQPLDKEIVVCST